MALDKLWREVKHDLSALPTGSSGRTRNKAQESCSLLMSLILLVAFLPCLWIFPQPHHGEARKKYICYIKSPFVLSRRLETGASLSSVYAISLSAFVGGLGGGELRGGDESIVLFFKQAWRVW